jgi:hypothetical protein
LVYFCISLKKAVAVTTAEKKSKTIHAGKQEARLALNRK